MSADRVWDLAGELLKWMADRKLTDGESNATLALAFAAHCRYLQIPEDKVQAQLEGLLRAVGPVVEMLRRRATTN